MADPITWGLINGVKKGVKTVQSTLDGLLDDIKDEFDIFIGDAEEVIEKLGTGLPPRDLAAFSSQSTEDGIKLTFTPPAQTYIDDGGTNQFAVMPAGVLIRYSDTGYPRTPDEGKFGYDYKPTGDWVTTSQECTIVGLTKDTKYYFTAFPYSTEHVYNKNQVTANRTEMTWVGNKGTISVTVNTPEGYEGTLGEYTITLVDQASDSPQNVEKSATGAGLTQFGGLTAGKSYKVRLSNTDDLQAPPDSEVITIVGGVNYDVTMTYALMYGTITVNVSTQPAGMPIGSYTVTLTPQGGGDAMQQSGNNSQAVVFSNVKNGVVYTVGLSAINHYAANAGGTVTAVGGQNISHNAHYGYNATLSEASWSEISHFSSSGKATEMFSIGDEKPLVLSSLGTVSMIFSHYTNKTMYFTSKELLNKNPTFESATGFDGYENSELKAYLDSTVYNSLPQELRNVLKPRKAAYCTYRTNDGYYTKELTCNIWPPFVGDMRANTNGIGTTASREGDLPFSYYTSESRRTKKYANNSQHYFTATLVESDWYFFGNCIILGYSADYMDVHGANAGSMLVASPDEQQYICFGFCV